MKRAVIVLMTTVGLVACGGDGDGTSSGARDSGDPRGSRVDNDRSSTDDKPQGNNNG